MSCILTTPIYSINSVNSVPVEKMVTNQQFLRSCCTYNCEYENIIFFNVRNECKRCTLSVFVLLYRTSNFRSSNWMKSILPLAVGPFLASSASCSLQLMCCCMAVRHSVATNTPAYISGLSTCLTTIITAWLLVCRWRLKIVLQTNPAFLLLFFFFQQIFEFNQGFFYSVSFKYR